MPSIRSKPARPTGKVKKNAPQVPETENEFLQAADDEEQGGQKWKAGDAAKGLRFFQRAIDIYDKGLSKYPRSFDLAYNKAVLQFSMTQDLRLSPLLGNKSLLLDETLKSHRLALSLDQANPDILSNTGQVLASCAERIMDQSDDDEDDAADLAQKQQAFELLKEALELTGSCLERQEAEFDENQRSERTADADTGAEDAAMDDVQAVSAPSSDGDVDTATPGEWATIVEAVTPRALLDTALASFAITTSLTSVFAELSDGMASRDADKFERTYLDLVNNGQELRYEKIPRWISLLPNTVDETQKSEQSASFLSIGGAGSGKQSFQAGGSQDSIAPRALAEMEADLAFCLSDAAIADSEFRLGVVDASTYFDAVKDAFKISAGTDPSSNPVQKAKTLDRNLAYSEALVDFASLLDGYQGPDDEPREPEQILSLRTRALALAQATLEEIIKQNLPSISTGDAPSASKAQIYLLRGDVELRRLRLATDPFLNDSINESTVKVLLSNAGVFYRGAANLATQSGEAEVVEEARVKSAVIAVFSSGAQCAPEAAIREILRMSPRAREIVSDMLDEEMIPGPEIADQMTAALMTL